MADLIPGGFINCLYFALVVAGLLFTIVSLLGSDLDTDVDVGGPDLDFHIGEFEIGGVQVPGVDLGVDAPEVDVSGPLQLPSISSFTIASAITGFGAAGITATLAFHVSDLVSLIWATAGGLVLGGAMQFFYGAVLLKTQGSSQVQINQLIGRRAEVTVPIAAGGNGQIAFVIQGRRVTYGARAALDEAIPRGASVEIKRVVGGTAVVRLIEEE